MPTTIRKAVLGDAPEISRVHVLAWQSAYRGIMPQPLLDSLDVGSRIEMWRTRLENAEGNIYVAQRDGELCGFISGGKLREPIEKPDGEPGEESDDGDYDAELYAVYLLPAARGQGIGKLLTRRLAEVLAGEGFRRMAVWVLAANPARNFYARLGAVLIAEKTINIGGADLVEVAYAWRSLPALAGAGAIETERE